MPQEIFPSMTVLKAACQAYMGAQPEGVGLFQALSQLPEAKLSGMAQTLRVRQHSGRVFLVGNGGSLDNARQAAQWLRACGLSAKTPGHTDDYLDIAQKHGHGAIFIEALASEKLEPQDCVIGISGSGNSENVLRAVAYAQEKGAATIGLTGYDGGQLKTLCAEAIVVSSHTMETVEDVHLIILLALARTLQKGGAGSIQEEVAEVKKQLSDFFTEARFEQMARGAGLILSRFGTRARCFVVGACIGSNHMRADFSRGATNTLGVAGFCVPELFTLNSALATANDDGVDFILATGLEKFRPQAEDLAILCETEGCLAMFAHCREVLEQGGTPIFTLGHTDLSMDGLDAPLRAVLVAMLGHTWGTVIRQYLQKHYGVRPVEVTLPQGHKKLGLKAAKAFEEDCRLRGLIKTGERLVFCYGKCFAASCIIDDDFSSVP